MLYGKLKSEVNSPGENIIVFDNVENLNGSSLSILQRVAATDITAVEECINIYGDLVWGLARKHSKTREDAEDAVQEIFIDIWKCATRFDPAKSPERSFVILIAKRRLIDRLRKLYRQPQTSSFENALEEQASEVHKKLYIYMETKPALDALNKLSFHEKQIIQMSIYGGISHSEIARTVGLPLGTVKTQIRRGLKKIRKSIELPKYLPV